MRRGIASVLCLFAWGRAEWTFIPPPPSDSSARDSVWSVAAHGDALWALASSGLYRSADTGRTWSMARSPDFPGDAHGFPEGGRLFSAGGSLFALTRKGLFVSTDNGINWARPRQGGDQTLPPNVWLDQVGLIRGDANTLLAGRTSLVPQYVSVDHGRTWEMLPKAPWNREGIQGLLEDGPRLWILAGKAYRSDDGGRSGQAAEIEGGVTVITFDKKLGALWAVRSLDVGISVSFDNGATWADRSIPTPLGAERIMPLAFAEAEGRLFASGAFGSGAGTGVYMTSDTGKTWVARNQGLPVSDGSTDPDYAEAIGVYALGNTLLARTGKGLYRSEDLGAHWIASNAGMPVDSMRGRGGGPDFIRIGQGRIYARGTIVDGGPRGDRETWYVSQDTGRSWKEWKPGLGLVAQLLFSASGAYAMVDDVGDYDTLRLYRSTDGMQTWQRFRGPWDKMPYPQVSALAVSGSHVFVAGDLPGLVGVYVGEWGVQYWRSADEGGHWETDSGLAYIDRYRPGASIGNTRFRAEGFNVAVSSDDGLTWKGSLATGAAIAAIKVANQRVLVRAGDSLFVTSDQGRSWRHASPGRGSPRVLDVETYGDRFFAATVSGLMVSRDGLDWEMAGLKGMSSWSPKALAASGDNLLALTHRGLFRSPDLGAHWVPVPGAPSSMRWLANRQNQFFAASDGQAWASKDSGKTWKTTYPPRTLTRDSLLGMGAGPSGVYLATRKGQVLAGTGLDTNWNIPYPLPGAADGYCALAELQGGRLILSRPEGGFANGSGDWVPEPFPGPGPHDHLVGDGQGLAVSSQEGIFLKASAGQEWSAAEAGLPADPITALAADRGRLFAASFSQGIWMNRAFPVAVRAPAGGPLLLGPPALLAGKDGPLFRLRLARAAKVRLTLHSAAGRVLAETRVALGPGVGEIGAGTRRRGALFYRLEIIPEEGDEVASVWRGWVPIR